MFPARFDAHIEDWYKWTWLLRAYGKREAEMCWAKWRAHDAHDAQDELDETE